MSDKASSRNQYVNKQRQRCSIFPRRGNLSKALPTSQLNKTLHTQVTCENTPQNIEFQRRKLKYSSIQFLDILFHFMRNKLLSINE